MTSRPPADARSRFSRRVEAYVRARPGYPADVLPWLGERIGLDPSWVVADIGAGTGLSTALFLDAGHPVVAVEPNPDMRAAAARLLGHRPALRLVEGSAEATGLPDRSVDLLVAAQAFHWFDPEPTRAEFRRILRPGGWVVLLWNQRRLGGTPFLEGYERLLLRHGTDYAAVHQRHVTPDRIRSFFRVPVRSATFPSHQDFDADSLRARVSSSSYVPLPGEPGHDALMAGLDALLQAAGGRVRMTYDTEVYAGQLGEGSPQGDLPSG